MPNEVKLLPCDCPFCGTAISKFMTRRNEPYWKHPLSGCVLSRFILVPDRIPDWNTRATDAARPTTLVTDEVVARQFHEAYERLAPQFSYETRKASAVPWEQVPENNRKLMIAVVGEVRASMPTVVTGEQLQDLGAIPGSHPADQAPSGLGASRFDPERSDIRAFLKSKIAKHYRYSRGWNEGHIPSAVASEAFADGVLDIPQVAGMIAGQEIDWNVV